LDQQTTPPEEIEEAFRFRGSRIGAPSPGRVPRLQVWASAIGAMLQRTLPTGFIAPCLPSKTDKLS